MGVLTEQKVVGRYPYFALDAIPIGQFNFRYLSHESFLHIPSFLIRHKIYINNLDFFILMVHIGLNSSNHKNKARTLAKTNIREWRNI
jgi:hypothetical protein